MERTPVSLLPKRPGDEQQQTVERRPRIRVRPQSLMQPPFSQVLRSFWHRDQADGLQQQVPELSGENAPEQKMRDGFLLLAAERALVIVLEGMALPPFRSP